jgi:hypothetical protein
MLGLHLKTDGHDGGRLCWQVQSGRGRIKETKAYALKKNARRDDAANGDGNTNDKTSMYVASCKRKQAEHAKQRAARPESTANRHSTSSGRVFTGYCRTRYPSLLVHEDNMNKDYVRDEHNSSPESQDVSTKTRACSICCPESFFCDAFANKITANRAHANQQWIFDLIRGEFAPNEFVFVDEPGWMLVQGNSHLSQDVRYLVIFKDTTLHTIRDLRQHHLAMLREVREKVVAFLRTRHAHHASFRYYFHYMPSVFQLHLHVCCNGTADMNRTQPLSCVMRNIEARDTWYRDALILFSPARATRSTASTPVSASQIYTTRSSNMARLCVDRAVDKQRGLCI